MSSCRGLLAALLLALAAIPIASAVALQVSEDSRLWATVNVCDTKRSPDTIGIRGSMPGSRDAREEMFMRFEVQYEDDGEWRRIPSGGDSGPIAVGDASRARQAGRSFRIDPKAGASLHVRGKVSFEWRLNDEVVRRAVRRTRRGHRSSAGSDPDGHSAPSCTIRA